MSDESREAYEDAEAVRAAYEAGRHGRTTDALDDLIAEVRSDMADQSRAVTLAAAMRKSYENGRVARERLEA